MGHFVLSLSAGFLLVVAGCTDRSAEQQPPDDPRGTAGAQVAAETVPSPDEADLGQGNNPQDARPAR